MQGHLRKKLNNLLFSKRTKNDVFKNMLILASGAIIARLIGLGSTPILTRIYTPEDFGVLAVFMAIISILTPFATLRYSVAIPLLKNDGLAVNLVIGSIYILLIVSLLISVVLGLFSTTIFELFSINSMLKYWWLFPIAILGSGLYEILKSWAIRQKSFKKLAKTDIYVTATGAIIKIIMGLMGFRPLGLLIGSVFTNIIGTFPLLVDSYISIKHNVRYISVKRIKFLFTRYREYPKYRLPSQFILVLSQQAPLFVLTSLFGTNTVGQFSLALMALSLPLSLLGNTTGQAYYAEVAKIGRKNPEKILEISKDVLKKLFLFSLVPFIVILLFSPLLFSIVFGEKWFEAGEYARILSIYMLTSFISGPIVNALSIFENQLLFFKLNIIRLGLLVITFFLTWNFSFSSQKTVLMYSITMSVFFLYVTYIIFSIIKKEIKIRNKD